MCRIFKADLPIAVSLKTRVGYRSPDEFENLVDIYARFPMSRLIVHPRLKTDLYRGDVRLEVLDKVLSALPMPLGYNGDLITPEDIEKTAVHYGNVFCVLAALLLGGYWGGLAGAVGMTIADLTTAYVTSAPKTFLLKLCIGLIVGLVAHKIFHLSAEHPKKYVARVAILASVCGMAFNIVADPLVGYFYKTYLLGVPQDISKALAKIATGVTAFNAVWAVVLATVLYLALRPALKKAGLFHEM